MIVQVRFEYDVSSATGLEKINHIEMCNSTISVKFQGLEMRPY